MRAPLALQKGICAKEKLAFFLFGGDGGKRVIKMIVHYKKYAIFPAKTIRK